MSNEVLEKNRKNKIKVFMKFPLMQSDSQYYKSLLENNPGGISYVTSNNDVGMIVDKDKFENSKKLKKFIRTVFNKTGLPFPSAFYVKDSKKYDLIHCAHCLCLNDKPWVADIEMAFQMWGGVKLTRARKYFVRKLLLSKNCKKIMPWTNKTKEDIIKKFPEVADKIKIVPFAMKAPKIKNKKNKKDVTILFIGRYFFQKGGLHALEAINRVTKKNSNVNAIIVSDVPKNLVKKYSKNKRIKFTGLVPFDKITGDIYPNSDIYLCPGYTDSFGFPFVEAQAFGLPVITVDGYARKEIVEDGKTGFVIDTDREIDYNKHDEEMVEKIVSKILILVKNKKLRKKMGEMGRKEVVSGKFSIKRRNKKLKNIYMEGIK